VFCVGQDSRQGIFQEQWFCSVLSSNQVLCEALVPPVALGLAVPLGQIATEMIP